MSTHLAMLIDRYVEQGMQLEGAQVLRIPLNDVKYNEQQQSTFFHSLIDRLTALPGVQSATVSHGIPLFGWSGQGFVTAEHPHPPVAELPDANYLPVAPRYFDVLGIPLIQGRAFSDSDTDSAAHVAIINQTLAHRQWPGQNPLGRKIKLTNNDAVWLTVVGVSKDVRTLGAEANFQPEIYACYTQHPWLHTPGHLLIRTQGNSLDVLPSVRRVVQELDPDQAITDVRTMEAVTLQPLALRRFLTNLLIAFALLAVLLASLGVYGVIAYSVTQRRQELGIRIALGADKRSVLNLVLSDGLRCGLVGICLGLAGSYGVTRLLSSQLYGVKATDGTIFLLVALLLTLVAAAATYLPARRAAQVDPICVLREE